MTTLVDIQHLRGAGNGGDLEDFIAQVRTLGVEWPEPPTEDILFHLATWSHIIQMYGHLDLTKLVWTLQPMIASALVAIEIPWDDGRSRSRQCARDLDYTLRAYRSSRTDAWEGTWAVAPYVIDGRLMNTPSEGLCLMEGHSRMGILIGSLQRGHIDPDSVHMVWAASTKPEWVCPQQTSA